RHFVRPQDRRENRRDPDEPAAAGEGEMSYDPVPDNELAAVVTYLEMRQAPAADVPPSTLQLRRVARPPPDQYRALFRKVGGPWLWFSRLVMKDDELEAVIGHADVDLFEVAAVEA